jgi:hypothetical protein
VTKGQRVIKRVYNPEKNSPQIQIKLSPESNNKKCYQRNEKNKCHGT